jgi:hypothetical protein
MGRTALPMVVAGEVGQDPNRVSPEWVRISYASAIALRFKSGRFTRDFKFGGINLLLNYNEGCLSDCAYCGLARTRPGLYEEKSFIRVDWPLVETDEFVARLSRYEDNLTRLCISMVTHGHSYRDTVDLTRRIVGAVSTPLSILVAPPTLNRERIEHFKDIGVDMIGVGPRRRHRGLFRHRTDVPAGGLHWAKYWEVIDDARDVFGPWKVNVHTLVGLGETDHDLVDLFCRLCDREIFRTCSASTPSPIPGWEAIRSRRSALAPDPAGEAPDRDRRPSYGRLRIRRRGGLPPSARRSALVERPHRQRDPVHDQRLSGPVGSRDAPALRLLPAVGAIPGLPLPSRGRGRGRDPS